MGCVLYVRSHLSPPRFSAQRTTQDLIPNLPQFFRPGSPTPSQIEAEARKAKMAQKAVRKRPPQTAPPPPLAPVKKELQLRQPKVDTSRMYPFSAVVPQRLRWGPFLRSRVRVIHRAPETHRAVIEEAVPEEEEEVDESEPLKVGDRCAHF